MAHQHTHAHNKKLINRMSKIVGHANSIKIMIEEGRDCSEVLVQIAAVRSALSKVGKLLLEEHINYCVSEALMNDSEDARDVLDELNEAIGIFIR